MAIRRARMAMLASALAVGACGPAEKVETRGEVFARYRAEIEAKWAAAKAVFELDPNDVSTGVVVGQPAPFSVRNGFDPEDTNIAILPAALLLEGVKPERDLYFRSPLGDTRDYLDGKDWLRADQPSDADFEASLKAAVATPYVGVYNINRYEAPEVIDDRSFKPGHVTFMFGVMDLANKSMIAACTITATNDEHVELPPNAGWEANESHVKGQLDDNARSLAAKCLADHVKGEFSFS